jgi:hypothetical protein
LPLKKRDTFTVFFNRMTITRRLYQTFAHRELDGAGGLTDWIAAVFAFADEMLFVAFVADAAVFVGLVFVIAVLALAVFAAGVHVLFAFIDIYAFAAYLALLRSHSAVHVLAGKEPVKALFSAVSGLAVATVTVRRGIVDVVVAADPVSPAKVAAQIAFIDVDAAFAVPRKRGHVIALAAITALKVLTGPVSAANPVILIAFIDVHAGRSARIGEPLLKALVADAVVFRGRPGRNDRILTLPVSAALRCAFGAFVDVLAVTVL